MKTGAGAVTGNLTGGVARAAGVNAATANANVVDMAGGSAAGATGGFAWVTNGTATASATASGNSVSLNGNAATSGSLTGGSATLDGSGDSNAIADGNLVSLSGAVRTTDYSAIIGGTATGAGTGAGKASAANNAVILGKTVTGSGALALTNVTGGMAMHVMGQASATGNIVAVSGVAGALTTVNGSMVGGRANSMGGSASATGNAVLVNNAGFTLTSYLVGGYASAPGVDQTAKADSNSLFLGSGTFLGAIYGGYSQMFSSATGTAVNNTVTLVQLPNFDQDLTAVNLYGGFVGTTDPFSAPGNVTTGNAYTGNTLNVTNYAATTITLRTVQNFQNYNFLFPVGSGPVMTVNGAADSIVFGADTHVTASTLGGVAPYRVGQEVTLVSGGTSATVPTSATGQHGGLLRYDWQLVQTAAGRDIIARVRGVSADPRAKSLSESRVSGLGFLTQGSDLVAGPGLEAADRAIFYSKEIEEFSLAPFVALHGGSTRYDTGSHADIRGYSLMTGLAAGAQLEPGRFSMAAFFEYGKGSYDAYNDFGAGEVRTDGDLRYTGGGLAGRFEYASLGSGCLHVEASGRGGRVKNGYRGDFLQDAIGRRAGSYDSSASYFGLHLGGGYLIDIDEQSAVDVYGQYFWIRQGGETVTLATQDTINFEAANSHRLRLGSRFSHTVSENVTPYAGLAWEHEFSGEAKASAYGYGLDAASLKGSSGLGELGLSIRPAADSPLSVDLGVNGYVGTKRGVQGSLQMKFEF